MKTTILPEKYGIFRLAAAVPELRVADVTFNSAEILKVYRKCADAGAAAAVFPELSVTGYSCGGLFRQSRLIQAAAEAADALSGETGETLLICGIPAVAGGRLFDVALVMGQGRILGAVSKSVLAAAEKNIFSSCPGDICEIKIGTQTVPFGRNLIFNAGDSLAFGIEFGTELRSVRPVSGELAPAGADVIFCMDADTAESGKSALRRELVCQQSRRCAGAYVYTSAGVQESTADSVFCGHALVAVNGILNSENRQLDRQSNIIFADADTERIRQTRRQREGFFDMPGAVTCRRTAVPVPAAAPDLQYFRNPASPFACGSAEELQKRCDDIFDIQCAGLIKRIIHSHARSLVIGISGGLDSTLALLVAAESCRRLGRPAADIKAVTMPGFGTTGRTYRNAAGLCRALGVTLIEIPIKEACLQHFADIGHDPEQRDVTYENAQARERTQILMDLANKYGGLVIGTGDLSEIALGWCTYNGDHMSMYAVNGSIPKTMISHILEAESRLFPAEASDILKDVIDTPVSPELLPPDESGDIKQKTESLIGPYELHDYFLWHFCTYGAEPDRILLLAQHAFAGKYPPEETERCLKLFIRRFFQQQFKRSCMPDGVKAMSISLSPRGQWNMPSDASAELWQE